MRHVWMAVAFALAPGVAGAVPIQWADWTSSDLSSAQGSVGGVGVTFRGTLQFAQLGYGSQVGGGASSTTDYWLEYSPAPYTGNAVVDNRPPGYELLAFNNASTNVLTFNAPVVNPLMAIVSQGQQNVPVTYDFDTPFTLLSEGKGFWGDGSYLLGPGDVLTGYELHGVIQFQGTVSQISWTSTQENWHGFTVGTAVPEPGTLLLIGSGLLGLVARRRRNS
jgi:hypothetical protein